MKRPILHAGLIFGALACGQAGCHQAEKAKTDYTPKKPDDPTAWTDKDVTKSSTESSASASSSGLAPSTRLKGTWSSDAQDIERSLGVDK
jgi:hypothetical protein